MNLDTAHLGHVALGDLFTTQAPGPTAQTRMTRALASIFPVVHTPYGL
jgi:hypothetical protein